MVTTTFKVNEIHCSSCENTIRTALSRLPGVALVVPSAARSDVRVSFDETMVTEAEMKTLLGEVGFATVP